VLNVILLLGVLFVNTNTLGANLQKEDEGGWNKTRAITELHFCVFILRDFLDGDEPSREISVLMEPDQVTENNLTLLFRALSEKYPAPKTLRVQVYTDVEQLGFLSTGRMEDLAPAEGSEMTIREDGTSQKNLNKKKKRVLQFAFYKRAKEEEFFTYNPNYPEYGTKTITLRSKQ
jgi:hypothetical protein